MLTCVTLLDKVMIVACPTRLVEGGNHPCECGFESRVTCCRGLMHFLEYALAGITIFLLLL